MEKTQDYNDVICELFKLRRFGMKPGLAAIGKVMKRLGDPHLAYRTIHIAGTKGKGTVSHFTASILHRSGYRVGLYTSPHFITFRERIAVNGELISKKDVVRLFREVVHTSRAGLTGNKRLTFFETATAMAFLYFREKNVDVAVIETGMGGRLDATNICMPEVCVITSIDYEHTEYLGNTLAKIAREKSGIIKRGTIVITAENKTEPLQVITETCRRRGAALYRVGKDISYGIITNTLEAVHNTEPEVGNIAENIKKRFSVYGLYGTPYEGLAIPMPGKHQMANAAAAIAAAEAYEKRVHRRLVSVVPKTVRAGLEKATVPCRFELVRVKPNVILDNAHTPNSICSLSRAVDETVKDSVILVFGVSNDKDYEQMLKHFTHNAKRVILASANNPRSLDCRTLLKTTKKFFQKDIIEDSESVEDAARKALEYASPSDTILVTGSSYVCGEALAFLRGERVDGLTDCLNDSAGRCDEQYIDSVFKALASLFGDWKTGASVGSTAHPDYSHTVSELASQAQSNDPFRILIATILSHRTKDENTHKATEKLFSVYKTPSEIAKAPLKSLERLIHSTGFYRVKAKNIKKASHMIIEKYSGRVPDTIDELLKIPAVGRKTANCVLVYAFNKPAIPVDTHVHRISNRLGLVRTNTPEDTEKSLEYILPKTYWLPINDYFVRFGKTICRPVGPKCGICPLERDCPSARSVKQKKGHK